MNRLVLTAALITPFIMGASFGKPDSDVTYYLTVYADSRWDDTSDIDGCDFCFLLPNHIKIENNYARAGAEFTANDACVDHLDPDVLPTSTDCKDLLDRATYQTSGTLNGQCGFQPSAWRGSTCIEDIPNESATNRKHVMVIDMGVNDTRVFNDDATSSWASRLSEVQTNLNTVLAANAARSAPLDCMLVKTAPSLTNDNDGDPTVAVINRRLGEVFGVIDSLASTYDCAVADIYSAVDQLPLDEKAAAYFDCSVSDIGTNQNFDGNDCVHYDRTGKGARPIANEIVRALSTLD